MDFIIQTLEQDISQEDQNIATGVRVPTTVKEPVNYLLETKEFSKEKDSKIKDEIKLSKQLYKYEGIVGAAVDALEELSITKLELNPTGNKELDDILKHYMDNVNSGNNRNSHGIHELSIQLTHEHFLAGNVFPFKYWGKMDFDKEYYAPKYIYLLNPERIYIQSSGETIGNHNLYYIKDENTLKMLGSDGRTNRDATLLKRSIKLSEQRKVNNRTHNSGSLQLNPKYVAHLRRKAQDYDKWGIPYLTRAFNEIASLHRLRQLDESTIESLINLITIFKIGTENRPANAARLRAFADLLKDPKATHWLVWAHDLEVEQQGPDGKTLQMNELYARKYEDIFIALGIPPILLGVTKQGIKGGDSYNQMLVLMSRLENWRLTLKRYYENVFTEIADYNGLKYDSPPTVFWHDLELNKDLYFKEFAIALYDRGLLDPQMVVQKAGLTFDGVVKRFEDFKKSGVQEKFNVAVPPSLPFSGTNTGITTDKKTSMQVNKQKQKQVDANKTTIKKAAAQAIEALDVSMKISPEDEKRFAIDNFIWTMADIGKFIQDLAWKSGNTSDEIPLILAESCVMLLSYYYNGYKDYYKDIYKEILFKFVDSF